MAKIYRENGIIEEILPADGSTFTLAELQTLVGGYIEVVQTRDDLFMVLDEEGKLKGKSYNLLATARYKYGTHDPIVGTVVVCTYAEIEGDEPEEECAEG